MSVRATGLTTAIAVGLLAGAATATAQESVADSASAPVGARDSAAADAAREDPAAAGERGPRIQSWTSDRQDYRPGDVLTVFVDERTLVRAVAENSAVDRRRGEGILDILPSRRLGLRTRNDAESEQRGRATRNERFETQISVRIEDVTRNGVLRIEGRKQYAVGEHEQKVILSGFVRPEDVSLANVVRGWRIADLELQFMSNGELVEPDRGLIAKFFDFVF
ncbi:MAG: flagellar basal body L-ring protein FlgH [Candidatus Palauibacterales bacterium]|nr:flagellar basal body L-ring protein FlgH [Candidatus Palauibacterales bacterium]